MDKCSVVMYKILKLKVCFNDVVDLVVFNLFY